MAYKQEISTTQEPDCRRWNEQRWLIDHAVRTVGVEFDQGRVGHVVGLVGSEAGPDGAQLRQRIQKFTDIAPEFATVAARREAKAKAAEASGALVTARENYFMAAHWWATAQWPILVNNEANLAYNQRKRECYQRYAELADHYIEAAWIPFQGKQLPGWLHLPPNYSGGKLPAVIVISGMDGYKERDTPLYGDRWLQRGMAVLTVDGPGQYESAVLGIPVSVPAWLEAGQAIYEWLAARPEIDPNRIGLSGRSFGTFFGTIAAAGEKRIKAVAISGTCHEPGCHTIFQESPPSFKRRFMYMAGLPNEAEFDEFAKTLTWEGHAEKIEAPFLCITGEYDNHSPLVFTERLIEALRCPKLLVIYQGAAHSVSGTPSTNLGPYFPTLMADWMAERLAGGDCASERWYVENSGAVKKQSLAK